jgi:hypothetical protein
MRRWSSLFIALACLAWATVPLPAASMYEFTFDQSVYEVQAGQSVTVSVYLYETVTSGTTSVLATEGLITAGVRLSYGSSPTDPATISGMTAAPNFTNEKDLDSATFLTAAEVAAGGTGAANPIGGLQLSTFTPDYGTVVAGTGGKEYQILLGTVTFTAGDVVGETTTIKASDLFTNASLADTTTDWGTVLDSFSIWTGTADIVVVPEPASWVGLLGMGLTAGICWRVRSRRARRT